MPRANWKNEAERLTNELCLVLRGGAIEHQRMKAARLIKKIIDDLVEPPVVERAPDPRPLKDSLNERMYG